MYCFRILLMVMLIIQTGSAGFADRFSSDTSIITDSETVQRSGDTVHQLGKMVVISTNVNRSSMPTEQPAKMFTSEDLVTSAGSVGDICRYLATLPSVVSSLSEGFDNALYVRGGRPSEVVFLVDGIEMENINHFSKANGSGGPLGFINSDFVKKVDFFAGSPPVAYPSRLSSVVAIDMKNGSFSERHSSIGCKLIGGTFSTEGPIAGLNSSYVLAGRYIDFSTLDRFVRKWGIPLLGDLYCKGMHVVNETSDLSLTGLLSYNKFTLEYPIVEYDDVMGDEHNNNSKYDQRIFQGGCGLTYRTVKGAFSHKAVFSGSFRDGGSSDNLHDFTDTFFVARYTGNPYSEDTDERYRATLTTTSDVALSNVWKLTFGIRGQYQRYRMYTNYKRKYQGEYTFCYNGEALPGEINESPLRRKMHFVSMEAGGYGEVTATTGPVTASLGLRADYFRLLRSSAVSPRLAIALTNNKIGIVRAIGGIQHQFPTEMPTLLFYTYSYFPEMEDRTAETALIDILQHLQPLRCYQASLGFERNITSRMRMKSDIYFKWYNREHHYISPKLQEAFYFNDEYDLILHRQNGQRKAYGFEGTLESPAEGCLHYALAGSVFEVKNRYRDGNWYDDWTNVGYAASLTFGMRFLDNHIISMSAAGNGGRPYCREVIVEDCLGRKTAEYVSEQKYYSQRIERLFCANFRYGYRRQFNGAAVELFVEVLNLFNSQPTLEYRFNGESFIEIKPYGLLPVVGGEIEW